MRKAVFYHRNVVLTGLRKSLDSGKERVPGRSCGTKVQRRRLVRRAVADQSSRQFAASITCQDSSCQRRNAAKIAVLVRRVEVRTGVDEELRELF
ncbi:hypothetical protein LMH87_001981 [Akanthomyces muscarius]|uniref:Uncharacterized protein n=1 Tax=Akanthomyces muscarius TaxID=2231603 RepID=A0A9W8Q8P6_AKAMU|nr:hypothetical protein LMH87_001981 [Akanthomyces muscarius]KAJ4147466.1 hypothetical protein LMH87_001981 [Akanthomyces muscarius]